MWLLGLAVWTAVGLLIAIAFGHMVPRDDPDQVPDLESSSARNVRYFRRKKIKAAVRLAARNAARRVSK
jgi:predicted outer membrane lipoprotein